MQLMYNRPLLFTPLQMAIKDNYDFITYKIGVTFITIFWDKDSLRNIHIALFLNKSFA